MKMEDQSHFQGSSLWAKKTSAHAGKKNLQKAERKVILVGVLHSTKILEKANNKITLIG